MIWALPSGRGTREVVPRIVNPVTAIVELEPGERSRVISRDHYRLRGSSDSVEVKSPIDFKHLSGNPV